MENSNVILGDIFHTPRLLGTFPFDKTFRLSKKLLAYCWCIHLVSVTCTVVYFLDPAMVEEEERFGPKTNHYFRALRAVSISVHQIVCTCWLVRRRQRVVVLMDDLRRMIINFPVDKFQRNRLRYGHALLISFLFLMAVSLYAYRYPKLWQGLREYLNGCIFITRTISFVSQFWDIQNLLVILLRESTQMLNRDSIATYDSLYALYKMVNEIYNPQILMTIIFNFLLIIYNLYALMLPVYPDKLASNVTILLWLVLHIVLLVSVIHSCNIVNRQMKKFDEKVYWRMIEDQSHQLLNQEMLNFHFIAKEEVIFTACGFFTINNTLICSMISVATTYLVIVLQFSKDGTAFTGVTVNSTVNLFFNKTN